MHLIIGAYYRLTANSKWFLNLQRSDKNAEIFYKVKKYLRSQHLFFQRNDTASDDTVCDGEGVPQGQSRTRTRCLDPTGIRMLV